MRGGRRRRSIEKRGGALAWRHLDKRIQPKGRNGPGEWQAKVGGEGVREIARGGDEALGERIRALRKKKEAGRGWEAESLSPELQMN